MVENVAGKTKASGEGKPTNDVKFKVKFPFQVEAHIVNNQAKPVPTSNFEENRKPIPTGVRVIEVNTGSLFTTIERWKDREELHGWVRRQAARAGFTISIDKSSTITPFMTMQCERSGEYKPPKTRKKPKLEGTGTRKCNCPFRLKCFFDKKKTQDWWIAMLCGIHNHDLAPKLSGHLLAGRLKAEEKQRVIDMTKSLAKPRNILTDLKEKNKESLTLIKQVYNARTSWCKGQREDKTELQYLITKLEKHQYVYFTRANSEETTLEYLFFAHPDSIDMLNTFPTVLVMDSTYKTNTYRMPLFEIVGVTSTKMTYSVAFAFLSFERENNFIWTLEMLVGLLTSKRNTPKVIVTDWDLALMKAIADRDPTLLSVMNVS